MSPFFPSKRHGFMTHEFPVADLYGMSWTPSVFHVNASTSPSSTRGLLSTPVGGMDLR